MNSSQVYKRRNESSSEYLRSFVTFYYYILLNKIHQHANIKPLFLHHFTSLKYYKFFIKHFIEDKNLIIFTLFNQIPIAFLPLPKTYMYFNYPVISFYRQPIQQNRIHSNQEVHLSKSLVSRNIVGKNNFWVTSIPPKKVKEFSSRLKKGVDEKYDKFRVRFPPHLISRLDDQFFHQATLFIYTTILLIPKKFNFNLKEEVITISEYFFKNKHNKDKFRLSKHTIHVKLIDINYMCILKPITKKHIESVYKHITLKQDALLYNAKKN